jgi:hypothetical protein
MQRIEISIKASGSEPLALVFASSDTPEILAERLRIVMWLVGQLDGHTESRRRASRAERAAPGVPPEPSAEA